VTLIAGLKEAGQQVLDESTRYAVTQGVDAEEAPIESLGGPVSMSSQTTRALKLLQTGIEAELEESTPAIARMRTSQD